jgi:hypothetical protein
MENLQKTMGEKINKQIAENKIITMNLVEEKNKTLKEELTAMFEGTTETTTKSLNTLTEMIALMQQNQVQHTANMNILMSRFGLIQDHNIIGQTINDTREDSIETPINTTKHRYNTRSSALKMDIDTEYHSTTNGKDQVNPHGALAAVNPAIK